MADLICCKYSPHSPVDGSSSVKCSVLLTVWALLVLTDTRLSILPRWDVSAADKAQERHVWVFQLLISLQTHTNNRTRLQETRRSSSSVTGEKLLYLNCLQVWTTAQHSFLFTAWQPV
jgi:hypothetical protein